MARPAFGVHFMEPKRQTAIVAGAAGFLGSHLCDALLARLQPLEGLDAIFLELHGAMATPGRDDPEAELLRRVPGVDVSRSGSAGKLTTVRIDGAASTQTLVLLDGMELVVVLVGLFAVGETVYVATRYAGSPPGSTRWPGAPG